MDDDTIRVLNTAVFHVGLLGATAPASHGVEGLKGAQIDMIERRILRIEAALRQAGIDLAEPPQ